MNPAERTLISGLFDRLRGTETAYRDPEAESFIQEQVARQPHAPYAMAQTLVVQNQSLEAAKARIDELERQLADARGGSFAQNAGDGASPWGPRASEAMGAPASFGGRQGYERAPDYGAPPAQNTQQQPGSRFGGGGGGFLSGALQTAAGVAGGALLFSGIQSMFGGGAHAAEAGGEAAKLADTPAADDAASPASEEGGWFSGLLGGVGDNNNDATPVADDDNGSFGGGDDGGDWT